MLRLLRSLLPSLRSALRTRTALALENLALRQQLAALRQQVKRPQVRFADRLFWAWLHRFWGRWREALILVQPETVIRWRSYNPKLWIAPLMKEAAYPSV